MGVNIKDLVDPYKHNISCNSLKGKIIALDAFNILYQFLSAIRQPNGMPLMDSKGNITSHLAGLFYRSISLMEYGLKLVYVFDGEKPDFKKEEIKRREKIRDEAEEKWKKSLEENNLTDARKYAQAAVHLNEEIIKEAKELISFMGMCYVDAPSEGEAEASYLAKIGKVYAAGSQDYDSLLFGSPILIRNLAITGKRRIPGTNQYKEISPEIIKLEEVLEGYALSREQLVALGILIGTDYAPAGAEGIGVKKALELVKIYKTPDKIFRAIESKWNNDVDPMSIYEFFLNPPVKDVGISFKDIDEEKIIELLVEKHNFSEDRVKNGIERLKKAKGKSMQKTLF